MVRGGSGLFFARWLSEYTYSRHACEGEGLGSLQARMAVASAERCIHFSFLLSFLPVWRSSIGERWPHDWRRKLPEFTTDLH